MEKYKAEKQAEELIGMNFEIPMAHTASAQAKLAGELARRLEAGDKIGKVFWAGAAAIVIINAVGLGLHFSGPKENSSVSVQTTNGAYEVADYYYTDKLNSY